MPNVLMNGVLLGKEITRDRFLKPDSEKIYDDLRAFGACGAPAIVQDMISAPSLSIR